MFLDIEEIRDKDNATGLKEGGGIEISTTVLSIYAMLALFRLNYLPVVYTDTATFTNGDQRQASY